jgi:uncharacterized protein
VSDGGGLVRDSLIGVISDTHGLLRPEALDALAGVDLIVHAGDVGAPEVLERLGGIARVVAVRGNNDVEPWASSLQEREIVEVAGRRLYVLHDLAELDVDPVAAGLDAVVSGHSHRPGIVRRQGVLFFNPGSAGPRRFTLPITVGRLSVGADGIQAEIVDLGAVAATSRYRPARPRTRASRRA